MIRRNRIVNAAMLAWLAAWTVALYALAPLDTRAAGGSHPQPTPCWVGCHAEPSGRIGKPLTGHKPHHTHKPPREHLTMPPTDTED